MADVIKLPELGEGVTEGELVRWLVKVGDHVSPDQPIAEFMTDKATVEVPSPKAGIVTRLLFKEGDSVKVESAIVEIDDVVAGVKSSMDVTESHLSSRPSDRAISQLQAKNSSPSEIQGAESVKIVVLPEIGEGVTEGELIKFLVKPGDFVQVDQALAEVMTDKATVEVPSIVAGVVKELMAKEGHSVRVGEPLVKLIVGNSSVVTSVVHQKSLSPMKISESSMNLLGVENHGSGVTQSNGVMGVGVYPPVADSRVLATPHTRRLARELGVDINRIQGTGLAGRVTRDDVLKAAKNKESSVMGSKDQHSLESISSIDLKIREERVPLRGIRKKIAENMQLSKKIIPHFTLMDEVPVGELVKLREALKEMAQAKGVKLTYLPLIMKSLITTCREFPMFNASIDDKKGEIVYKKYFHIGFAADTPQGLVVPVVKEADQKTVFELAKEIQDLADRARGGKLKPEELKGATITITNIGSIGGTYATPIINHPEVAILGLYRIVDRPIPCSEKGFRFEKYMNITITADHRLIDGAVAARFLKVLSERISSPQTLLLELR